MKNKLTVVCFLLICNISVLCAQEIKVEVTPDAKDWVYKLNQEVEFKVLVTKGNTIFDDATIRYEIGAEMMEPAIVETASLKAGTCIIKGGTLKEAGFLRCKVYVTYNGKEYNGIGTAAFSPETILATTDEPKDFLNFWKNAKDQASRLPLDARLKPLPDRGTEKVDVYEISFQNLRKESRIYGILCVPSGGGEYPAILRVPGAGVRAYNGSVSLAEKGCIVLEIGIHGIPVTLDSSVYENLRFGALYGYQSYNLDSKDLFYYKRVFLGCVRAIDFIFSLPEFDGENVVVAGPSQGGALSIVTAALDDRIKGLAAFHPALCDMTGYLHNRAGGWPHVFNSQNIKNNNTPEKIETSKYYDVANFAHYVKVPGYYSWGYNDVTCPPTSMYAAYNQIKAQKTLSLFKETGHWVTPKQWDEAWDFLFQILKK